MVGKANETLRTIDRRRSTRTFTDKPVPDEHLRIILSAANQAPSAHNQQSWRFIVIRGGKKKELANLISNRASQFPRASAALLRMAATSLGLATVWLGIMFLIKDEILELLQEPKGEFMAIVPVGYPEREAVSPKKRPLEVSLKTLK